MIMIYKADVLFSVAPQNPSYGKQRTGKMIEICKEMCYNIFKGGFFL